MKNGSSPFFKNFKSQKKAWQDAVKNKEVTDIEKDPEKRKNQLQDAISKIPEAYIKDGKIIYSG